MSWCFGCGRTGHWIKDCPKSSGPRGRGPRGRGRLTSFLLVSHDLCVVTEQFCYRCGEHGHIARDCDQDSTYGNL
uniref:CCHC-type zinc finger, nucleic acid binding protein a n=1 Tax=Takifugu rubripes TaxID=31033 RepID=A0A674MEP4_TAKRU